MPTQGNSRSLATRISKGAVRALMLVPISIGAIVSFLFLAVVVFLRIVADGWDNLELWAFYDGDAEARKHDQWNNS